MKSPDDGGTESNVSVHVRRSEEDMFNDTGIFICYYIYWINENMCMYLVTYQIYCLVFFSSYVIIFAFICVCWIVVFF